MATGQSTNYNLPYPQVDDNVNVHGDIALLATQLDTTLAGLGLSYMKLDVKNVSGENIGAATPVCVSGFDIKTTVTIALPETQIPILGLTKSGINNNAEGIVVVSGVMTGVNTSSFSAGQVLYVKDGGGLTATQPSSGGGAVGVCAYADASNGIIVVEAKGNGTWGALKSGLA